MAAVVLSDFVNINVVGAFTTYDEAHALACEIFTCIIAAVARTDKGEPYLRPAESRDSTIFCYAVLSL